MPKELLLALPPWEQGCHLPSGVMPCPTQQSWDGGQSPGITMVVRRGPRSWDMKVFAQPPNHPVPAPHLHSPPLPSAPHLRAVSPLCSQKPHVSLPSCEDEQPPRDTHRRVAARLCHDPQASATPATSSSLPDPDTHPTTCLSKCCYSSLEAP